MSHGSYDSNLGLKRLILAGDIRSRSWPNISDSYGKTFLALYSPAKLYQNASMCSSFQFLHTCKMLAQTKKGKKQKKEEKAWSVNF